MTRTLVPLAALVCGLTACSSALRPVQTMPRADTPPPAAAGPVARTLAAEAEGGEWAEAELDVPTLDAEAAAADAAADVATPAWDIEVLPYLTEDRVAFYLDLYSGRAREATVARLRRGTRYEPMIRAKLRAAGLPEDLYYLALVESGYDPNAYSRAAAVGMWQFMAATARAVGLRVDWWVDERRDPVRSTDAAVRYLDDLRDEFDGSLYLAAAAYNGGSGRVSRGLAQFAAALDEAEGEDRFFALAETGYLRDETRDYVPQLIAAALIAKSPGIYGIDVDTLPPFAYDSVRVPAATPLAAIAAASDTTVGAVRDLNPQYLRGITPPGDAETVRVPVGAGATFADRFAALPAEVRTAFTRVTTRDNGRLSAIARAHGFTEAQVAVYNPGIRRNRRGLLVGGQEVLVPSRAVVGAALDLDDPGLEASTGGAPRAAKPRTYRVKKGDALEPIAHRYGLTVRELRALNGLTSDLIHPGQLLVVEEGGRR
ncbi:MAG TPA: transglycosylase SLT domain-containing protein [Gemmatimonadaceae bacterium]|nr:transglycosylase SLT domain-containing protein [Gemmatimonadaceae bacterium]